jgi:hypothetical protein
VVEVAVVLPSLTAVAVVVLVVLELALRSLYLLHLLSQLVEVELAEQLQRLVTERKVQTQFSQQSVLQAAVMELTKAAQL